MADAPVRRFVSEKELEEERKLYGAEGSRRLTTNAPAKSLYEQLQENKEKAEAAFEARIKPQPPKAMDEEEYNFLEDYRRTHEQEQIQRELEITQALVQYHEDVSHITYSAPDPKELFGLADAAAKNTKPLTNSGEGKKKKGLIPTRFVPIKISSRPADEAASNATSQSPPSLTANTQSKRKLTTSDTEESPKSKRQKTESSGSEQVHSPTPSSETAFKLVDY